MQLFSWKKLNDTDPIGTEKVYTLHIQMETFSALLAFCAGSSLVNGNPLRVDGPKASQRSIIA